jgi:hypothetical protein
VSFVIKTGKNALQGSFWLDSPHPFPHKRDHKKYSRGEYDDRAAGLATSLLVGIGVGVLMQRMSGLFMKTSTEK